ncbi:hypothetical protein Tco_1114518 [Tanacetum coccineum]|uniref:Uncharacterized protein n=1 Tax=Tanacetum coccineum TaxID=301880 RepID=A0ABQ5IWT7_9ASTR
MAISSSSSSSSSDSEVQQCSKCLESFKCLQKNYDTEREKHNKAKLEIRGYEIALESLESRIIGHEKNELAWGDKYEFQNYVLKCREIKINNLNLELEKALKERDELKDKIAKWEESTKNLKEILKSQMSARDKTGLGYSTQLNELSNNHEIDSENSLSIFDGRSSDDEHIPENDRFSKNRYKVVPPPITGNFLTPRADISFAGLDEYAIRNKIIESQTTELNNKTGETAGKTNDANTEKPKSVSESVVSNPKINRDSVIIEDWTSDDEEEVSGVQKVRLETRDDKSGQNSHKQGVGTARPSISTSRPSVSTARPVSTAKPSINIARPVSTASPSISIARPGYASRSIYPRTDNVRPRDELKFNLFSVSQMCDKKNSVLFTESECLILSPSFKLLDESQVVLRAPRKEKSNTWIKEHCLIWRARKYRGEQGYGYEYEYWMGCEEEINLIEEVSIGSAKVDSEDWDAIRAKLEANAELTKDVLGKDLPEQDFAKRMVDMVNQRKKHFVEERAKAKRNKPMTQSQLRIYMSNYLKNQGTWKLSQLKKLSFEEIKEEFDKYGEKLRQKTLKKQKIDDKDVPAIGEKVAEVKEEEPVKRTGKRKKQKARKGISVDKNAQGDLETDKEESVEAINPTPLATKSNTVVNWKIFQQGQRSVYQIMRANRVDTVYVSFGSMIKDFTRETMFYTTFSMKMLFGAYHFSKRWLVGDRKHPLSKDAYQVMIKMKLLDGTMDEVCYKLLKMIEKQAGIRK